jgi:hypothetical protein
MTTKSFLFDIQLAKPAVAIQPFAVSTIKISPALKSVYDTDDIALYKQSWAMVSPNLIADARFGIFTQLILVIDKAEEFIEDKVRKAKNWIILTANFLDDTPSIHFKPFKFRRNIFEDF